MPIRQDKVSYFSKIQTFAKRLLWVLGLEKPFPKDEVTLVRGL